MKKEEKDECNERLIKAGRSDWRFSFPTNRPPVVRNDQKTKEFAAQNEVVPEHMTATYWG